MKKLKPFVFLLFILLLGLMLRFINLDKSGGLWYDEATIYSIASQKNIVAMLHTDIHRFLLFPLYYIIYNAWLNIFGNSDIIIRFMSVVFDILSIITAYFTGKQLEKTLLLKSKTTGLIYALLYAINSSFIYYSQEAKFYSLTFLLINLIMLFWLKYIKNQSYKNILLLTLFSFILITAYISQIVFLIILYIATIIYLKREHSLNKIHISIFALCFIPVIILLILYKNYFSGNFTAVVYDNSFIFLALQNMFSPILLGLQNNVLNYQNIILLNIFNVNFWLFIIFPVAFMIYLIVTAFREYKIIKYIVTIGVVYLSLHIIMTNFSEYNVLVRYILHVLQLFLLFASVSCTNKAKNILLRMFVLINLVAIFSSNGAPCINRPEGYRTLALTIKNANISSNYNFIFPIRTNLLDKYYSINGKKMSLYDLNSVEAQKTYLSKDEINHISTKQNKYIKHYLKQKNISSEFEKYVQDNYIKNYNHIVVLTDKSISLYSNEDLIKIVQSENYEQYPFQFLRMSKLNNDLITVLKKK